MPDLWTYVTAFAMNGSAMIHDFEIALVGATSEDVDASLGSGTFGTAEETGRVINEAISAGAKERLGTGEAIGRQSHGMKPAYADKSLLHSAYEAAVPVTVHVAIGTDIVHIHPAADGASVGQTSLHDFICCVRLCGNSMAEECTSISGPRSCYRKFF